MKSITVVYLLVDTR